MSAWGVPAFLFFCCCTDTTPVAVGPLPSAADSIVWVETPEITHDRDYHAFAPYVNPDFPKNWLYPVNYSEGRFTMRVELISLGDSNALPVYYTVGWKPGDESKPGFTRIAVKIDKSSGVYSATGNVKSAEKVVNGYTVGSIGDEWYWENAWRNVAGDTWDMNKDAICYPMNVRVKIVFHQ